MKPSFHESRLWMHPKVIVNILRHPFVQDTSPLLFNARLYYFSVGSDCVSYCVLMESRRYCQLNDVFCFKKFRGKGYATRLISHVVKSTSKPVYLICRQDVSSFYKRVGFFCVNKGVPISVRWKLFISNVFSSLFFGFKNLVMVYR